MCPINFPYHVLTPNAIERNLSRWRVAKGFASLAFFLDTNPPKWEDKEASACLCLPLDAENEQRACLYPRTCLAIPATTPRNPYIVKSSKT